MATRRRVESSNYRNPCLTMHQPWASLLVYGIKRVEGRSWPAPVRGCVDVVGCVTCEELVNWEELLHRGLSSVKPPLPVKFPLPDPKDPYSLKPSSLASRPNGSRISEEEKSPSLVAAIAGARAAIKNNMSLPTTGGDIESDEKPVSSRTRKNSGEAVQ
ncbi:Activating signal cointegrator 1 [Sesamum angolense]|uniref:Activating signal cointegrator 1 n=1 Tax=Sesamum angolense TaxID=2727404 RepID=A0AAE2BK08_9LAMI|nr:Activating signal cointegrator 1 [Sesamum angolense]